MKHTLALVLLAISAFVASATTPHQAAALNAFKDRIGGRGAHKLIVTEIDTTLAAADGSERFVIGSKGKRPMVKGSSMSATTAGLNWYLNHYAHVNLAWNRPSVELSKVKLPVPRDVETHTCVAPYRYYLNYCTFSYTMSTWTWERWQQEIDWMALHGINMPLQIVGLDVVWYNILTRRYGYTPSEANAFVAGPCFQAWWGMNNLEGWGGPNPAWWYERQAALAQKIVARERQLGIEPVLPGYAGMVPSDFARKTGMNANGQGKWCRFLRPYILDPNSDSFASVARAYYAELDSLMGTSRYYSIDPFHEGANTEGIDVPAAYRSLRNAMVAARPDAKWVIQQWQWSKDQYRVLDQVEPGRLIVLDLFSDGHYGVENYRDHEVVYCSLPNFGGRTGLFGRVDKVVDTYFKARQSKAVLKGIGAAPEAIEQTPVLYDMLFELPWLDTKPDTRAWINDYVTARYGTDSPKAREAWQLLHESALNCTHSIQGPHEAVMCGRPALDVKSVSAWGGSELFYDPAKVVNAARALLDANLSGNNYTYDLVDLTRQALSDRSKTMLAELAATHAAADTAAFAAKAQEFMQLILDTDSLLNTHPSFMIGSWTEMARDIASEVPGTTEADADWLEHDNARTLITVWGPRPTSELTGLHDYSYRQKGGMLRDFYLARWRKWFDEGMNPDIDWFDFESRWVRTDTTRYPTIPRSDAKSTARYMLDKYFK